MVGRELLDRRRSPTERCSQRSCPFVNVPETHKARWGETLLSAVYGA
jgi:hypothetical protein